MLIMPRLLPVVALVLLCLARSFAADAPELASAKAKVSYLIGRQMAESLKAQYLADEVDLAVLAAAIQAGLADTPSPISDEMARETMAAFSTHMREKVERLRGDQGTANRQAGDAFLAACKAKDGWQATDSGLLYHVVTQGDGAKPSANDIVEVNYRGTLVGGDEFDSSYKRGAPATFPVRNVIQGWQEALQMMPVGSKWELVIPSDLAYGEQGKGHVIGPHAVLCFEVELLSIKEAPKPFHGMPGMQ